MAANWTNLVITHQQCKQNSRISNVLQNCGSSLSCCLGKGKACVCMKKCSGIPVEWFNMISIKDYSPKCIKMGSAERKRKQANQLNARIRDRKTASVPPRSGAISNLGFFSKHLLTDFVKISSICKFVFSDREISIRMEMQEWKRKTV